jgi:hypothetical protein
MEGGSLRGNSDLRWVKSIIRDFEPESWICKICRIEIGVNNVLIIYGIQAPS